MSLMQLLSISRSVNEPKDGPTQYKLQINALPKFAPAKRPVSLAPAAVEPAVQPAQKAMMTPSLFDAVSKTAAAAAPLSVPAPEPAAVHPEQKSKKMKRSFWQWLFGRRAPRKTGVLQPELALGNIKPVRNDLSDSDFEIREVNRKPSVQQGSLFVKNAQFAGRAWSRLSAKISSEGKKPAVK